MFDRVETVRFTQGHNSGELVEKRANAFAAAFLCLSAAYLSSYGRLDKGQPSGNYKSFMTLRMTNPRKLKSDRVRDHRQSLFKI